MGLADGPRMARVSLVTPASPGGRGKTRVKAHSSSRRQKLLIKLIPRMATYPACHTSTGAFSLLVSWFSLAETGKILSVNLRLRANNHETDTPVVSQPPATSVL